MIRNNPDAGSKEVQDGFEWILYAARIHKKERAAFSILV